MTNDIHQTIAELKEGLEGVTPGPWRAKGIKFEVGKGYYYTRVGPEDTWIAELPHPFRDCGAWEDAKHIARCDPDTMRALIEHVEEMEAENELLRTGRLDELVVVDESIASLKAKIDALSRDYAQAQKANAAEIERLRQAMEHSMELIGEGDEAGAFEALLNALDALNADNSDGGEQ